MQTRNSAPKNAESVSFAGKVMASVFWTAKEIVFEKAKTITGEYYSKLLIQLDSMTRKKISGLRKKKNIFLHDTALML